MAINCTDRRMAGSMMSGLLVAPMMNTFFLLPMPSISVRIWLMTLSLAPPASPEVPPRDLAILSNSSKKSTQGAAERALQIMEMILGNRSSTMCRKNKISLNDIFNLRMAQYYHQLCKIYCKTGNTLLQFVGT